MISDCGISQYLYQFTYRNTCSYLTFVSLTGARNIENEKKIYILYVFFFIFQAPVVSLFEINFSRIVQGIGISASHTLDSAKGIFQKIMKSVPVRMRSTKSGYIGVVIEEELLP